MVQEVTSRVYLYNSALLSSMFCVRGDGGTLMFSVEVEMRTCRERWRPVGGTGRR